MERLSSTKFLVVLEGTGMCNVAPDELAQALLLS